ncbi:MAG: hypothetical protein WBE40_02835 [Thermoplasmata archaeon]
MRSRRPPPPEDALARCVLDRHLGVRRGESVTVETWSHALPWARALVIEARRRGARPVLLVEDESAFFRSLELAGPSSVRMGAGTPHLGDAYVYLGGPEAFPRLLGLPAHDRDALAVRHDRRWWVAARRRRTRAVRLAVADATAPAAARYGVDREAWQAELVRASLVDPRRLERSARRVLGRLGRARRIRVRHPNGTDLEVRRAPAAPLVRSGRPGRAPGDVWGEVPSGLLVVPLTGGAAEGVWESNRPAYDRFVEPPLAVGARWTFSRGRLSEFAFEAGGEPFESAYSGAGRSRGRPVALTVGLNPAISRAPELQELAEGTLGLLLGDRSFDRGPRRTSFSYLSALAGADADADGRPWLAGGTPTVGSH